MASPHVSLEQLRARPEEWRRRGLTPPDELQTMIDARVHAVSTGGGVVAEPSYSDFFGMHGA